MADGQSTALARVPIQAGGAVAAIIAHSFEDAQRIALALATSGVTPFKRPEEALAAIMAGGEIGMAPMASLQSFMIVNGRLSMWGDAQLALVRSKGHKVEERYEGSLKDDTLTAFTKVTRCDTGEVVEESFSVEDAKRAKLWNKKGRNGDDTPWVTFPKRMLKYRARAFALRDGCSDVLRGIAQAEEMQDVEVVDSVVIDRSGDHDQRPAEERDPRVNPKYGVIGGQAGKDAFDDFAQRMSEAAAEDELDAVWEEAEKTPLSKNRMEALTEYCEAVRAALRDEAPIPAPPRFTEAPEPSPFAALSEQALKVCDAASFAAFNAELKAKLGACSADERGKLQVMHAAAKQRVAQTQSGAAASRTDEDAGDKNAQPGGSAPPASSSPFEALKEECLAILQTDGVKRRRAKFTAFTAKLTDAVMAQMTPEQRAELDKVNDNVGKEIGA